jgi:hypothetical protein
MDWRKRARITKSEREQAALMCRCNLVVPHFPCVVRLTRVGPRKLDSDNVATAFKATRDGIADWLQVDDGDESLVTWEYGQERGAYAVRVEVVS